MQPKTLDHVAFWVADREPIVAFLERHLGMHVITREDNFTSLGSNARRGKLTLFDAEGPREPGALKHVGLRVSDLAAARAALPDGTPEIFEIGGGIRADVRRGTDRRRVRPRPRRAVLGRSRGDRRGVRALRIRRRPAPTRVEVGGAYVEFHEGDPGDARAAAAQPPRRARRLCRRGDRRRAAISRSRSSRVVDAANTYAAFLWGPERVRIEYVEHKPTFSLT